MTKEVAVKQKQEVATRVTGRGFENVDMGDITMPRAKLLQSNSPEVSDRDYTFRAGDLIHTMIMETVPERFIPLSIWGSNILFTPRAEDKKPAFKSMLKLSDEDMQNVIICNAADGKMGTRYGDCATCGKHKFAGNEKPICTATINVLAVPYGDDGLGLPFVVQFANTSYKHGKKFRDTAFYSSMGGDLFGRVYKFDTVEAAGSGNKWFELKVKPAGVVPEELAKDVVAMYESFAGRRIVVDESQDETVETVDY